MDQSTTIGNRRSRRSNVLLAASIESGGTVTAVKLRDLSAQGARIEGEPLPPEAPAVAWSMPSCAAAARSVPAR